jgi:hypothetical protein
MPITDYLIAQDGIDWEPLLRPFHTLLPAEFTVWLVNRYGDVVFVRDDGTVHFLDIGGGSVKRLAQSRDEFLELIDQSDNANQWLMIPLVDRCVAAGVTLPPGHCYSYRQSPVLGGDYTVANTAVVPLAEHYGLYGALYERLKDAPDGTRVHLRVHRDA